MSALRLADHIVKDAVDAESDDEVAFKRLDVDVGGLFLHSTKEKRVDELDDRSVVLSGLQDIDRAFQVVLLVELALDLVDKIGGASFINAVDRVLDLGCRR